MDAPAAERANGIAKLSCTEDAVYDGLPKKREDGKARADRRAPSQTSTATLGTRSCKRCVVGMKASAIIHPAYYVGIMHNQTFCVFSTSIAEFSILPRIHRFYRAKERAGLLGSENHCARRPAEALMGHLQRPPRSRTKEPLPGPAPLHGR